MLRRDLQRGRQFAAVQFAGRLLPPQAEQFPVGLVQRTYQGRVVACLSSCLALGGDQMCCLNAYAGRAACDPTTWPVDSAAVFKKAEPFAYSYAEDDATSVLTCTGECDYRITWGTSP